MSERFGRSLSGALDSGTASGRKLDGVLGGIGTKLASTLTSSAVSGLQTAVSDTLTGALRSLSESISLGSFGGSLFPFARGGVVRRGQVQPFAAGGIVSRPTYFPMARGGVGLMGEAGPEAVMPLARSPDGRLGVRAAGGAAPNVTVNIQAADLDSFKRSEAQVAAALARAVARGRRAT